MALGDKKEQISEAFGLCARLMLKRLNQEGYEALPDYPGVLSMKLDDERWKIECHAQKNQEIHGLQPYVMRVLWNDWPAGMMTPIGGAIAAGELANEDTLIAALEASLNG